MDRLIEALSEALDNPLKFRTRARQGAFQILLYDGKEKVGAVGGVERLNFRKHMDDQEALEKRAGVPTKKFYVVAARLLDPYQGKGLGTKIYTEFLKRLAKKHGAVIVGPDSSVFGQAATSKAAGRVWASLRRTHPSSGPLLLILPD